MKNFLRRAHWILSANFGLDPLQFARGVAALPRYFLDRYSLRGASLPPIRLLPALHDRRENAGSLDEYIWQDITVARMINEAKPERHIDIGSKIAGLVAHVAAFRAIEVLDVRPLASPIPNVRFTQANLTGALGPLLINSCDSLSCLHALEHFGLGRYGDPIDAEGPIAGLGNMSFIVRPGGMFYLSIPVGKEVVDFNANWIFDPRRIVRFAESKGLHLARLLTFSDGPPTESLNPTAELERLATLDYCLALFVFRKELAA